MLQRPVRTDWSPPRPLGYPCSRPQPTPSKRRPYSYRIRAPARSQLPSGRWPTRAVLPEPAGAGRRRAQAAGRLRLELAAADAATQNSNFRWSTGHRRTGHRPTRYRPMLHWPTRRCPTRSCPRLRCLTGPCPNLRLPTRRRLAPSCAAPDPAPYAIPSAVPSMCSAVRELGGCPGTVGGTSLPLVEAGR